MAHLPAQQTMFQRMQESSREQTFSHLLMAWMFICLRKLTSATPVRPTKNTHTISKSCQVLKSGSLHKRRQQECGEQKSMWINHCWLRFVLEHIPRYSSTQARHHCPIRSKMLQWLFPNNFLMAFMFIYVHLKFQYSSMKIERSMILWPQILTFFLVSKEVDHRIIHERPEEASNCKAPFQHLRLRPGYVDMAVSCHGWV